MAEHKDQFRLHSMCRVLRVQRSGYYSWKKKPKSKRTLVDESLLLKIRESFEESQSTYGSPRMHCDLREDGVLFG
jgi:putative transposase